MGSNLGDRIKNVRTAAANLLALPGHSLVAASSLYRCEPIGEGFNFDFINAVVGLQTSLNPHELLQACRKIENQMGRDKATEPDRAIDLDILFFEDIVLEETELVIPHPRIAERRFVLEPLAEAAPDLIHPVLGCTAGELLSALGESQRVERLKERPI